MAYGLSFQPSQDNAQGGSGSPKAGTQNAVQLLSLRMPTIAGGAQSIAPQGLLDAQGGAGVGGAPDKNALLMWLKRLLSQSGADMPPQMGGDGMSGMGAGMAPAPPGVSPMGMDGGGSPAPRITPSDLGGGDLGGDVSRGGSGLSDNNPYPDAPPPTGGGDFPPLAPGVMRDPFDVGGY